MDEHTHSQLSQYLRDIFDSSIASYSQKASDGCPDRSSFSRLVLADETRQPGDKLEFWVSPFKILRTAAGGATEIAGQENAGLEIDGQKLQLQGVKNDGHSIKG